MNVRHGLALLVFSAGLAWSCSGNSPGANSPDAGADSGPPLDASPFAPDGSPEPDSCPYPVDPSTIPTWVAADLTRSHQCSNSDLATISNTLKGPTAGWVDVYNSIASSSCRACVFSSKADAAWQALVWSPDMASNQVYVNYGACYYVVSGSTKCGASAFAERLCIDAACDPLVACNNAAACQASANSNTCSTYAIAKESDCGQALGTADPACSTVMDVITVVCGPSSADASDQ